MATSPHAAWQDVRVSLGADAEVKGKLSFAVPTRVEGKLRGEISTTDLLVVGPQSVVEATVRAVELVVLGEVKGEVLGARRVQVCSGGRLYGDVQTQSLVIDEGARFEGACRMPSAGDVAVAAPDVRIATGARPVVG